MHELWASPVVISLTSLYLFLLPGFSALVDVSLLICSLFLTSKLCDFTSILQARIMQQGDRRISLMVELVQSMKLIKLYAWEAIFVKQIGIVRAEQLQATLRQSFVGAANRCLGLSIPLLVSLSTFTCFVPSDGWGSHWSRTLDASTAFTSLLLFNTLKEPLGKLPECMNNFVRMKISLERIGKFLEAKEKEEYVEYMDGNAEDGEEGEGQKSNVSTSTSSSSSTSHPATKGFALEIRVATFDWGVRVGAAAGADDESMQLGSGPLALSRGACSTDVGCSDLAGGGSAPARKFSAEVRAMKRKVDAELEVEGQGLAGAAPRLGGGALKAPIPMQQHLRPPSPSRANGAHRTNGHSAVHMLSSPPSPLDPDTDGVLELHSDTSDLSDEFDFAALEAEEEERRIG